jgi:alkylated DNA repair dioxygenase AlkB
MQRLDLGNGSFMEIGATFFSKETADRYFLELQSQCRWEQKPGIFGHMQPRLISSYGEPGISYRYSGANYEAIPWNEPLLEIRSRIQAVRGNYNYCLLNRYRDGADSMGWHADNEPELDDTIASLSLGATRKFRIRNNHTRQTMSFELEHGTLLIMYGTMQNNWMHEVPKTKRAVGERINLTFRRVRTGETTVKTLPVAFGSSDESKSLPVVPLD